MFDIVGVSPDKSIWFAIDSNGELGAFSSEEIKLALNFNVAISKVSMDEKGELTASPDVPIFDQNKGVFIDPEYAVEEDEEEEIEIEEEFEEESEDEIEDWVDEDEEEEIDAEELYENLSNEDVTLLSLLNTDPNCLTDAQKQDLLSRYTQIQIDAILEEYGDELQADEEDVEEDGEEGSDAVDNGASNNGANVINKTTLFYNMLKDDDKIIYQTYFMWFSRGVWDSMMLNKDEAEQNAMKDVFKKTKKDKMMQFQKSQDADWQYLGSIDFGIQVNTVHPAFKALPVGAKEKKHYCCLYGNHNLRYMHLIWDTKKESIDSVYSRLFNAYGIGTYEWKDGAYVNVVNNNLAQQGNRKLITVGKSTVDITFTNISEDKNCIRCGTTCLSDFFDIGEGDFDVVGTLNSIRRTSDDDIEILYYIYHNNKQADVIKSLDFFYEIATSKRLLKQFMDSGNVKHFDAFRQLKQFKDKDLVPPLSLVLMCRDILVGWVKANEWVDADRIDYTINTYTQQDWERQGKKEDKKSSKSKKFHKIKSSDIFRTWIKDLGNNNISPNAVCKYVDEAIVKGSSIYSFSDYSDFFSSVSKFISIYFCYYMLGYYNNEIVKHFIKQIDANDDTTFLKNWSQTNVEKRICRPISDELKKICDDENTKPSIQIREGKYGQKIIYSFYNIIPYNIPESEYTKDNLIKLFEAITVISDFLKSVMSVNLERYNEVTKKIETQAICRKTSWSSIKGFDAVEFDVSRSIYNGDTICSEMKQYLITVNDILSKIFSYRRRSSINDSLDTIFNIVPTIQTCNSLKDDAINKQKTYTINYQNILNKRQTAINKWITELNSIEYIKGTKYDVTDITGIDWQDWEQQGIDITTFNIKTAFMNTWNNPDDKVLASFVIHFEDGLLSAYVTMPEYIRYVMRKECAILIKKIMSVKMNIPETDLIARDNYCEVEQHNKSQYLDIYKDYSEEEQRQFDSPNGIYKLSIDILNSSYHHSIDYYSSSIRLVLDRDKRYNIDSNIINLLEAELQDVINNPIQPKQQPQATQPAPQVQTPQPAQAVNPVSDADIQTYTSQVERYFANLQDDDENAVLDYYRNVDLSTISDNRVRDIANSWLNSNYPKPTPKMYKILEYYVKKNNIIATKVDMKTIPEMEDALNYVVSAYTDADKKSDADYNKYVGVCSSILSRGTISKRQAKYAINAYIEYKAQSKYIKSYKK